MGTGPLGEPAQSWALGLRSRAGAELARLRARAQGGDLLDWTSDHGIQEDAFIQRIEALSTMGYSVLLSNYRRYFKLASYLATFTREPIVIAMGLPSLEANPTP